MSKSALSREMLEKDKNVCQFFLRGHCKFGKRCYKKHVSPEKIQEIDDKHLRENSQGDKVFLLEVRFPNQCNYPFGPPLVRHSDSGHSVIALNFISFISKSPGTPLLAKTS